MDSQGEEIFCRECGKRWRFNENGTLKALEGGTVCEQIPDWFAWEREQVKAQIERGEYSFFDDIDVYSQPRGWEFEHLGSAKISHDAERGFILEGYYNDAPYRIQRTPIQHNSLHVEYDWCYVKPFDCFDISTENDSFFCYPKQQNVITKLAFATEIIYEIHEQRTLRTRRITNQK